MYYKNFFIILSLLVIAVPLSAPLVEIPEKGKAVIPIEKRKLVERPNVDVPGVIDWEEAVVKAKGQGVIDTVTFKNKAQAKLAAQRAATVVAQRNLLEIIKGVRVVSETKVVDLAIKNDYIYTRLDGVIKGAKMVGEPIEKDGIIEVELEVPLYLKNGIAPVVCKALLSKAIEVVGSLSKDEKDKIKAISSIVIDATGADVDPALFPRIVDEEGNVLFDLSNYYDPENPNMQKFINYTEGVERILNDPLLRNNPYVLKILRAKNSDLVVSKKNKEKAAWLKNTFKFFLDAGKTFLLLL